MFEVDRRRFVALAGSLGATLAWNGSVDAATVKWVEKREFYPDGVASGDPEHDSVILWTRRPFSSGKKSVLTVQIANDVSFDHVISTVRAPVLADADWTCRVVAAGLKPSTTYWYRFIDETGAGSRIGRTMTAPLDTDAKTVRFAFVSCQSVNEGAQNAYRRMIWEDERASPEQKLGFVLHLGDFIYEVVEYPDEVAHRYDRIIYDIGRVPDARKVGNFHVPTTLQGYRTIYRAHIRDQDIQDARALWPFVCIGDNHEFSWQGWQSFTQFDGKIEPAQGLKVAANQAWWEYIPSRVAKASGLRLDRFAPPPVVNSPIVKFDDYGFGDEVNNRAAIASMTAYRSFRYGRHVDIIITDLHSYMMQDPTGRPEADAFNISGFPFFFPQEALEAIDGGRDYLGGNPPDTIPLGSSNVANFRKAEAPFTVLGQTQKRWLKDKLKQSNATWKIWAATNGTLDMRADPQNLPLGLAKPWPGQGYATFGGGDFSSALTERAEIYDLVRDEKIEGFVTVSGDRHSFWAGYAAKALPPAKFEPDGISFITGSLSAAGLSEALEHGLKKNPLRPLFTVDREGGKPEATINLLLKRGVLSALEYAKSGDIDRARALTNPALSPHLEFVDMSGHGYAVVTAAAEFIDTEFVCVPRPIARANAADGGPLSYRVAHRADRWSAGGLPELKMRMIEGDAKLSI